MIEKGKSITSWKDKREWTNAKVKQPKPVVILPLDTWRTHWQLTQFSSCEYSTLLEIKEQEPGRYRVTDWYLPYQSVTGGSVTYTKESALGMVKDIGDRFENFYGVHHVHPWTHKGLPTMSYIDVDEMWDWVANAGRGVFIVSDAEGKASATYVTKENDLLYQVDMSLLIDYALPERAREEFRELFEERVIPIVYQYKHRYDGKWPRGTSAKSIDDEDDWDDDELAIFRLLRGGEIDIY